MTADQKRSFDSLVSRAENIRKCTGSFQSSYMDGNIQATSFKDGSATITMDEQKIQHPGVKKFKDAWLFEPDATMPFGVRIDDALLTDVEAADYLVQECGMTDQEAVKYLDMLPQERSIL